MVGAIGAALLPMTWARRHTTALLGSKIQLPARRDIDRRLVGEPGFRHRLGLAGCMSGAGAGVTRRGYWQAWLFVLAMLAGMGVFNVAEAFRSRHQGRV